MSAEPRRPIRKTLKWIFALLALWIIWSIIGAITNPPSVAGENYHSTFDTTSDDLPGLTGK